ncbi:MAG: hypothetical protein EAZ57_02135 [Cytophagales bacterium]|nr:MAG: hypothetical protein EAZ67_02450 [Cytophagales bacterium]TAF61921.1 MAG: hypothetical protein EAZ57_02135 [Cytophagales bacterium]
MFLRFAFIFLFFLSGYFVYSQRAGLPIDEAERTIKATDLLYYEDENAKLDIKDIIKLPPKSFVQGEGEVFNLGNKRSAIWVQLSLQKNTEEKLLLEILNPFLDNFEFYYADESGQILVSSYGNKRNFQERTYQLTNFVLDLPFENRGQTKTFYIKLYGELPMALPMRVSTWPVLTERTHVRDVAMGLYFGIMLAIALYNLFLLFATRDIVYVYYVIYAVSLSTFYGLLKGYSFEFLWGDSPILNNYVPSMVAIINIAIFFFMRNFLNMQTLFKKTDKVCLAYSGLNALLFMANAVFGETNVSVPVSQLFSVLGALLMLGVGIYAMLQNLRTARFFVLAWSVFLLGIIVFVLGVVAVLPLNHFTENVTLYASALETILLSLALADRINLLKEAESTAQKAALEQKVENEKLVREQNAILEQKVADATQQLAFANQSLLLSNQELGALNEELMTTFETVQTQNDLIKDRSVELENVNHELNTVLETVQLQKNVIEQTNVKMLDSIRYAQTIQNATLPTEAQMQSLLHNCFALYKPKDIVSGDFYWLTEHRNLVFLVAADCTGHGVPAAFLSLVGSFVLDRVIKFEEIIEANRILERVDVLIRQHLNQNTRSNADSIDMALCVLDYQPEGCRIQYSGAHFPMHHYQASTDQIVKIKPTSRSIGGRMSKLNHSFESQVFEMKKGDAFYLVSDGIIDQNNADNEKLGSARLHSLLHKVARLTAHEQKQLLTKQLADFQNGAEQRDDQLLLGVRIV